ARELQGVPSDALAMPAKGLQVASEFRALWKRIQGEDRHCGSVEIPNLGVREQQSLAQRIVEKWRPENGDGDRDVGRQRDGGGANPENELPAELGQPTAR